MLQRSADSRTVKDNVGCVVLSWINLDDLGITEDDRNVQSFHDEQVAFFQSFQAKPSGYKPLHYVYAKPDIKTLQKTIPTMLKLKRPLQLIVHGVFMQFAPRSTYLITPFIHCLELLFNETNQFAAARVLKVCIWMLSIYKTLQIPFNQCVCGIIQSHRDGNHLHITSSQRFIEQHCYKNHLNPFKILLQNLHRQQRKCATLDISKLADTMLSILNISSSLSTLQIKISLRKMLNDDKQQWQCPLCTFINTNGSMECRMCGIPQDEENANGGQYFLLNDKDAAIYKQNLLKRARNTDEFKIVCGDFSLKKAADSCSAVQLRTLLSYGVKWMNILIMDEHKGICCKIDREELLVYDPQFSILHCNHGDIYGVYRLLVLYYETRRNMIGALLRFEAFQSVAMRNYLGLIADYVFGVDFANDDVYDKNTRSAYCNSNLQRKRYGEDVEHAIFFTYWMSKYCLTDTIFLEFYAKSHSLKEMKQFCSNDPELNALFRRFISDDDIKEEDDWCAAKDNWQWYQDNHQSWQW